MKTYLSLVVIALCLLNSCKTSYEPLSIDYNFFPLKIGNKWYYNTSGLDTDPVLNIYEVKARKEINGTWYYLITNTSVQHNLKDSVYYRLDNAVLSSISAGHEEVIIADFSLNKNDYAYWDLIGDLKVTEKTESIITFERPFQVDYGSSVTYKKGIGIIRKIMNGYFYSQSKLVRAELVK